MSTVTLYHGDCLDILPTLAAGSVDAVVTDPPYGINMKPRQYRNSLPKPEVGRRPLNNPAKYRDSKWDRIQGDSEPPPIGELVRVSKQQIIWGAHEFGTHIHNSPNIAT